MGGFTLTPTNKQVTLPSFKPTKTSTQIGLLLKKDKEGNLSTNEGMVINIGRASAMKVTNRDLAALFSINKIENQLK